MSCLKIVVYRLSKMGFNFIFPCVKWFLRLEACNQHLQRFIIPCLPMLLKKSNFPMTSFLISSS